MKITQFTIDQRRAIDDMTAKHGEEKLIQTTSVEWLRYQGCGPAFVKKIEPLGMVMSKISEACDLLAMRDEAIALRQRAFKRHGHRGIKYVEKGLSP